MVKFVYIPLYVVSVFFLDEESVFSFLVLLVYKKDGKKILLFSQKGKKHA